MMARYLKLGILLIVAVVGVAYVWLVIIPEKTYETAKKIGQDFRNAFQFTPEVTVKNTIVLNQQTSILELATLSQNFQHRYSWTNTWMGSTKQIDIMGTFEAKCGFDLQQKFSIRVEGNTATVYLPEPKILSIEPQGDMTFRDEHGIWNWVNEDDRALATNAFITDARLYATKAAFVNDSKKVTEEKIRELLQHHVNEVAFVYEGKVKLDQGK